MQQIISLIVLIVAILYTVKIRKQAQVGHVVDALSGGEKIYIWISSLINPIFSGAAFYYGWKKMLPHRAQQSNKISLWAFLIEVVLIVLYFLTIKPQ